MSNAYLPAIEAIKEQIAQKEAAFLTEILPLKSTANQLCRLADIPELYATDAPSAHGNNKRGLKFREDEFFGKPLAGSVAVYFEARDQSGLERPSSIDEIYEALISGGFKFEGSTGNPENSKRALKIALTKNTAQFVKIGDKFALKKWYNVRGPRKQQAPNSDVDTDEGDSAEPANNDLEPSRENPKNSEDDTTAC